MSAHASLTSGSAARSAPAHALTSAETAARTPHAALVEALRSAALELARGRIACPPRQAVGMREGTLLSMVASAADITVHKLVTVMRGNPARGLPTLQGHLDVLDSATGASLMRLDAATVTGRRTAALSMLGIEALAPTRAPSCVLVIGTGAQALQHVLALRALHPDARIEVLGRTHEATQRFCAAHGLQGAHLQSHADAPTTANAAYASALHALARAEDSRADVVVACTSSRTPVYAVAAAPGRLLIATGVYQADAAEIAPDTVRSSHAYVDDPEGALDEAGDLLTVGVDWSAVRPLAAALERPGEVPRGQVPILFKTVGCAAWELAAARVALGL